jgi:hypothetical protein
MIENNISPVHPDHTRLYIGLAVVALLAFMGWTYNRKIAAPPSSSSPTKTVSIMELMNREEDKVQLTLDEQTAKDKILTDPNLTAKATLTPQQKKEKAALLRSLSDY